MRILLVEDNQTLADWLSRTLRKEHYTVDWINNGADADFALRSEHYNLLILDLAIPKLDGKTLLKRLRARHDNTPVMILTADNSMQSRVSELDHGADDYMVKPFDVQELEARIRVLLRRAANVVNPLITCGDLCFNTNTKEFMLAGEPLPLTPRERAVLELLILKMGNTVPKQILAQSLFSMDNDVSPDAIEIYVHRLRKKLEKSIATIVTLRGFGYLLREVGPDA
nr:response regulator [uncultured Rhodoferax sp.]